MHPPTDAIDLAQILSALQHGWIQSPFRACDNILNFYKDIEPLLYSKTPIAPNL